MYVAMVLCEGPLGNPPKQAPRGIFYRKFANPAGKFRARPSANAAGNSLAKACAKAPKTSRAKTFELGETLSAGFDGTDLSLHRFERFCEPDRHLTRPDIGSVSAVVVHRDDFSEGRFAFRFVIEVQRQLDPLADSSAMPGPKDCARRAYLGDERDMIDIAFSVDGRGDRRRALPLALLGGAVGDDTGERLAP